MLNDTARDSLTGAIRSLYDRWLFLRADDLDALNELSEADLCRRMRGAY